LLTSLKVVDQEVGRLDAPGESTDRVDERGLALRLNAPVEHDHGLACVTGTLDRRRHGGRTVRRDDERVAVAFFDEVVDVGDLRIIAVLSVPGLHLGDHAPDS
jgi:hypothetical protein